MSHLLTSVAMMRPDAVAVWDDPEVRRRLSWYRQVMTGKLPAKFMLCKGIQAEETMFEASEEELWTEHVRLSEKLSDLSLNLESRSLDHWNLRVCHPNLLDLKCELANRMLEHCDFCEWNCRVNRAQGKVGFCRLDSTTSVSSYFHHYGEEAPLIGVTGRGGSGTIFFESCNSRCVFCQNWDISQPKGMKSMVGEVVNPVRLAEITDELTEGGAANINYVGGEPTVDLHTIINSLKYVKRSVPLIWNSNMYCSIHTMKILRDLVDLWLSDFKFWNAECARRLMCVGAKESYPDVARRNHMFAAGQGSMIIRHLVMPGHVECCTKPILAFIAETMGESVLVNVMAQYHPANLVARTPERYREIARPPSGNEIRRVYAYARGLNLQFKKVS
jgi:putative pyruvate formate lyase activating enzyme